MPDLSPAWDYPPYPYVQQVIKNCPKAAETYFWLWAHKDPEYRIQLLSDEVVLFTLLPKRTFYNNCVLLARECLLNMARDQDRIEIELVGWSDE